MILNKNEKDQQQPSTGHFLSYSHQHLPEQQQPLNDNTINNNNNNVKNSSTNETKLTEAGDDGGFKLNDSWKSSVMKQEQEEGKGKVFLEPKQQQQLSEKNISDPGGGIDIGHIKESNEKESESKEGNDYSGGSDDQQQIYHPSGGDFKSNLPKPEKLNEGEREKQSYSYHSAHEYQQHQNMVNNIKKEPGDEAASGNVKFEGYEKNYQNFIRYADFCDAQQPQYESHQKQAQYPQDYMQSQGYYNNYGYQNYSHHQSQNYPQPHSQNYQQFMSQQAAYQQHGHHHPHHSASLTNFEQQIPLHTYPIPKHNSSKMGEPLLQAASIKSEPIASNPLHSYPFLSENIAAASKNSLEQYSRKNNEPTMDNACNVMMPKEEVRRVVEKFWYSEN